jgi:hypothetical protein
MWVKVSSDGSARSPSATVRARCAGAHRTSSPAARLARASAPGLDRRRDAGEQPAAADRHQHQVNFRQVRDDLQADGALPGDHVRVVERRDQRQPALPGELVRRPLPLGQWNLDDLGAERPGRLDLDRGRAVLDHDDRRHAERPRGVGDRLRVVAARVGDDATLPGVGGQRRDGRVCAADLERADRLQVLRLEPQLPAGPGRRRGPQAGQQRGADRDAADALGRGADVIEGYQIHAASLP